MIKKIDTDGLSLCKIQGTLFEESANKTSTSSSIFIRRFMNSSVSKEMDSIDFLNNTKRVDDIFLELDEEFGKSDYGKIKYNTEVLYWIGYIYRYFAYTYNLSSKQVYNMVKPDELNKRYYVFHTFDPAYAIDRILEEKGISFDEAKLNDRLLKMIRASAYKENLVILPKEERSKDNVLKEDSIFSSTITLIVEYKDMDVAKAIFSNTVFGSAVFLVSFLNEKYKNEEMVDVIIRKVLLYAIDNLNLSALKIEKDDELLQNALIKIGATSYNEDLDYKYFNIPKNIKR